MLGLVQVSLMKIMNLQVQKLYPMHKSCMVCQKLFKVKEPQEQEFELLRSSHVIFGYLHLASNLSLTKMLLAKKLTAIATEMIMDENEYPLLIPMSKIAGNLAIQKGMQFLEYSSEGKGLLLSSISDERN